MIYDHNGKPMSSPAFSPETLKALQCSSLRSVAQSLDFMAEIRGVVLDHRGEYVKSRLHKIGDTIIVRKPYRFVGQAEVG